MQPTQLKIHIKIASQTLFLWQGQQLIHQWPVSSSRFGLGSLEGSFRTPLGAFCIAEKHGANAPLLTIFKARQPVGLWNPDLDEDDYVLTRILWLSGLQSHNSNTYKRYIYIHGTGDEKSIGRPSSHGCIRMRNQDVIDLFDLVPINTQVWIEN